MSEGKLLSTMYDTEWLNCIMFDGRQIKKDKVNCTITHTYTAN